MGVSLSKGGNVSLSKEEAQQKAATATDPQVAQQFSQLADSIPEGGLTHLLVGLGWDARTTTGEEFDTDAAALLLNTDGKVASDADFVFFNNLKSPDGSVEHSGDNRTGLGEGDDEVIKVNLAGVPADVDKIVFPVSIHNGEQRGQNFGQIRNAYVRVLNPDTNAELARYDLSEDASTDTAMVFGELYRNGATWKFRAIGQGYTSGLRGIAADFGVNV
jgi:tellurium resistance protein TerD